MYGANQQQVTRDDIASLRENPGNGPELPSFSPLAWFLTESGWRPALVIGQITKTDLKQVEQTPSKWYDLKVFRLNDEMFKGSNAHTGNATYDVQATIGRSVGQFIPCDMLPALTESFGQNDQISDSIKSQADALSEQKVGALGSSTTP